MAQQVFDAFQSDGEPWASFSLSRVRKACAKVNKECASAPAPPSALAALPAGGALAAGGLASSDGAVDLRAAYVDFRDSEMRWLYSLPVKRQAQLFDARSTGPNFPAQHVMQNGEVALLLAGQKPCVLFGHFKWQGSASEPSFGAALAKEARARAHSRHLRASHHSLVISELCPQIALSTLSALNRFSHNQLRSLPFSLRPRLLCFLAQNTAGDEPLA